MSVRQNGQGHVCGAKKRGGGLCKLRAGHGTDHVGIGRCKHHGGCTPNHEIQANRIKAERAVVVYGLSREIDPHSALLEELHRTAGHVSWLSLRVSELEEPEMHEAVGGGGGGMTQEEPSVWIRLYQAERKHFADVAKTCVSVGIEERRVRLAEAQGILIAQVITGILTDLGVLDDPKVPSVVRRHLSTVPA